MHPYRFFRLNKVFDDFLVEAFVGQTNTNSNNNNNNQGEAAVSSSIPIKQERGSDEICIVESDDGEPQMTIEQESINQTATLLDIQTSTVGTRDNSVNEPGSSNDRGAVKKKSEKGPRKTKLKPLSTCEVCKRHFKSRFGLVYHRRIHLD